MCRGRYHKRHSTEKTHVSGDGFFGDSSRFVLCEKKIAIRFILWENMICLIGKIFLVVQNFKIAFKSSVPVFILSKLIRLFVV